MEHVTAFISNDYKLITIFICACNNKILKKLRKFIIVKGLCDSTTWTYYHYSYRKTVYGECLYLKHLWCHIEVTNMHGYSHTLQSHIFKNHMFMFVKYVELQQSWIFFLLLCKCSHTKYLVFARNICKISCNLIEN